MVDKIQWPRQAQEKSPFGHQPRSRPFRLTLHSQSFIGTEHQIGRAVAVLHEFCHLPEVEAYGTSPGEFPELRIGPFNSEAELIPVSVQYTDGSVTQVGIHSPEQLRRLAAHIAGAHLEHPDTTSVLNDLLPVAAHRALGNDIFVTASPWLLLRRARAVMNEYNIRSPSEACEILGLFLRSRTNYTYRAALNARAVFDRDLFYWVVVRSRLPSMWRYFSACVYAEEVRKDNILPLGGSVLERCKRALQARDAIGVLFYNEEGDGITDSIAYHLYYLALLLAGALDAQARVAYRAYGLAKPKERDSGFRADAQRVQKFLSALKDKGAIGLVSAVEQPRNQQVIKLLLELRNTIHEAELQHVTEYKKADTLELAEPQATLMWEAAVAHSSPENWGLMRDFATRLEPYSYARTLTLEVFRLIDEVARLTDVEGLFMGQPIPPLGAGPPEDATFGAAVRERLGWLG